ncbi:MAG: putative lipoic acid-binding regulatory protein [Pseudomonadales bacterium]|jgi:putative lipoic acid-binding regulatory protein
MTDSTGMSPLEELMDFPSTYTIKVVGNATDDFAVRIHQIIEVHAADSIQEPDVRPSSKGRFVSVNITFVTTSVEHLHAIHRDVKAADGVKMIL